MIVVSPPVFDQNICFIHGREYLSVQKLVAELGIKALVVTVLPWTAGLDKESFHADAAKPVTYRCGGKFRAIDRTNMLRWAVRGERLCQSKVS